MIQSKPKKCKGTGIAKGHGCGQMKTRRRYGLGMDCCFAEWLYNTPEGKEKMNKSIIKATATRKSLEQAIEEKKRRNKLTDHLNNTKTVVHQMVRERDRGLPCISCGVPYSIDFQAGHCFASGDYNSIRFHFDNIHGQCGKCNLLKDGNESEYRLRLSKRIGSERFKNLVMLAGVDKKTTKKWTRDELHMIRKEAKEIIKNLKTKQDNKTK